MLTYDIDNTLIDFLFIFLTLKPSAGAVDADRRHTCWEQTVDDTKNLSFIFINAFVVMVRFC